MSETTCFADVETGGLRPGHPTIQVAAVAVDDCWIEVDSVEVKLKFDPSACDPEALALNSYDPEVWAREAVPEPEAHARLHGFFTRHRNWELLSAQGKPYRAARIACHNTDFDIPRLRALWGGEFTPFVPRYAQDTLQLALWAFAKARGVRKPRDYRLTTLCEHFGIDTANAHDALADCRMTAQLARVLQSLG